MTQAQGTVFEHLKYAYPEARKSIVRAMEVEEAKFSAARAAASAAAAAEQASGLVRSRSAPSVLPRPKDAEEVLEMSETALAELIGARVSRDLKRRRATALREAGREAGRGLGRPSAAMLSTIAMAAADKRLEYYGDAPPWGFDEAMHKSVSSVRNANGRLFTKGPSWSRAAVLGHDPRMPVRGKTPPKPFASDPELKKYFAEEEASKHSIRLRKMQIRGTGGAMLGDLGYWDKINANTCARDPGESFNFKLW